MDQFVSTFTNKIDAKGRVSVPASFRTVLAKDGFDGIYCYPSLDDEALDAGGQRLVDKIQTLLEDIAPYSDERDQLAMALFGASDTITRRFKAGERDVIVSWFEENYNSRDLDRDDFISLIVEKLEG